MSAANTDLEFELAAARAAAWVIDYLGSAHDRRVLPEVTPGEVRSALPPAPPERGEPLDHLLQDFERLIVPAITHWNHPRFFAYFATTGSEPGILAELLIAALNVNAMLWRTSPAATEVEEVACDWLRQAVGLPDPVFGCINDTASSSTLYALAAAREALGLEVRRRGLSGLPPLVLYTSEEAHSSVEKAGIVLGVGQEGVVKVPTDAELRMDVAALERAVAADRAAGRRPFAVVATVGTTSTTAVDPVPAIADLCQREGLWLHVDAAYGGAAAVVPELRWALDGCERADSLVINPHKWLFTPMDCSVLYCRREEVLRRAFSLVPDYLTTSEGDQVRNLMDYGTALGRRFRGLKLWFVLRAFGLQGLRERIAAHVAMARELRGWVEARPEFEVLAPTPFSTVVFRHRAGDEANRRIEEVVNRSGGALISHTTVRGRYALRVAIGNLRTTLDDVRAVWELILRAAAEVVP
ncbi:MAG TPA: pyridoxal-dependent decarboxylase [Candidatus Dormibacteraeota bacterium]|jgi:aromatic-L-amino-acid decarboxylase|nr:pyridoxal-dependent decarboxylase [Candidatus Dormibacteraeota bacterium]